MKKQFQDCKHCCEKMKFHLDEQDIYLDYNPVFREYFIDLRRSLHAIQCIWFCPWCGKSLPSDIRREWFDIMEKEYGLEDPRGEQEHLVPEEFKSDEWWKKLDL